MKKVLALGHALYSLRQFCTWENIPDDDMELLVLTADNWPYDYGIKGQSKNPNIKFIYLPCENIPRPDYVMIGWEKIVKDYMPDLIFIMQEPWQKQTTLALNLAKELGIKTVLFSWENINPFVGHENWGKIDYFIGGNLTACEFALKNGIKRENILFLPQAGVNIDIFKDHNGRIELPWTNVSYAGRFASGKGIKELIGALDEIFARNYNKPVVFTATGFTNDTGADLKPLLLRLKDKWPGKIRIASQRINYELMGHFYNNAHIFVYNSMPIPGWMEQSMGYGSAEAMACGCAVITTNAGAITDYLKNSGAIIIDHQRDNQKNLVEQLDRLIRDEEFRKRTAEKCKNYVMNNYSHIVVARKYREFLRKFI